MDRAGGGRTLIIYDQRSGDILGLSSVIEYNGPRPNKPTLRSSFPKKQKFTGVASVDVPDGSFPTEAIADYRVVLDKGEPKGLARKKPRFHLEYATDRERDHWGCILLNGNGKDKVQLSVRVTPDKKGYKPGPIHVMTQDGDLDTDEIEMVDGEGVFELVAPKGARPFKVTIYTEGCEPLFIWFRTTQE